MRRVGDEEEIDLPDAAELDEGFSDARRLLDDLRQGRTPAPALGSAEDEAPDVRGEGQAADGKVVATVRLGGDLESVVLDPRALRAGPQALGEQLAEAINHALEDLSDKCAGEAGDRDLDPRALAGELTAVQDQAAERAAMVAQGLDSALATVIRRAREG